MIQKLKNKQIIQKLNKNNKTTEPKLEIQILTKIQKKQQHNCKSTKTNNKKLQEQQKYKTTKMQN